MDINSLRSLDMGINGCKVFTILQGKRRFGCKDRRILTKQHALEIICGESDNISN